MEDWTGVQTAVGQEIRWTGHLSNGSLMEDWTGVQTAVGQEIRWTGHLSNGSLMEDWTGVQTAVGQEIRWKTERRRLSDAEDKPPTSLQPCLLVRYFRPTAVPRHDSREQDQQHHNRVACA